MRWDNFYETMQLARGENIRRSDQPIKVAGDQASYKENQVRFAGMKAVCFLLSADQNRYSLLLKQLRDGDDVCRDEYPITSTSALGLLIRTEGGIWGNRK